MTGPIPAGDPARAVELYAPGLPLLLVVLDEVANYSPRGNAHLFADLAARAAKRSLKGPVIRNDPRKGNRMTSNELDTVVEVITGAKKVWLLTTGEYEDEVVVAVVDGTRSDAEREALRLSGQLAARVEVGCEVDFITPAIL